MHIIELTYKYSGVDYRHAYSTNEERIKAKHELRSLDIIFKTYCRCDPYKEANNTFRNSITIKNTTQTIFYE